MSRNTGKCICCSGRKLQLQYTLISPFLAKRAWDGKPVLCALVSCQSCGIRYFDRGLSDQEAQRYYTDYRGEDYFLTRRTQEPFYTLAVHNSTETWLTSPARRTALQKSLDAVAPGQDWSNALDWGGGSGILLNDIKASRKAVFDLNPVHTQPGIEVIKSTENLGREWDLVVCAQVLEHLADPLDAVLSMAALLRPDGLIYLEVPDQHWRAGWQPQLGRRSWLQFLCKRPKLLKLADCISTASRVKLGWLPPYGFVPMREHINFFALASLKSLLIRSGFLVVHLEKNALGCLVAVGRLQ